MELRRFYTAGEVDDGKSTLIGRLFLDVGLIYQDQLTAMDGNLAHFTDGLREERAKGITMDVAYRFFETPTHKFIVADAPGHLQYIRHMVTAASLSDAAVILVDATRGVSTQTKRHAWIAQWLGVKSIVFVINKMDSADYSQENYQQIKGELAHVPDATFIPASALKGDNILHASKNMPWYTGPSLMTWLQDNPNTTRHSSIRFTVQNVLGDNSILGKLVAGQIKSEAQLQSTAGKIKIEEIHQYPHTKNSAQAGESLRLKISGAALQRGDLIFDQGLSSSQSWQADWLLFEKTTAPLLARTQTWEAQVTHLHVKNVWDWEGQGWISDLSQKTLPWLQKGLIQFSRNLHNDPFLHGTNMGQMILIDSQTGKTVGAVLLRKGS